MTAVNNLHSTSLLSDPIQEIRPKTYVITGEVTRPIVERILNLSAKEILLNECILKEKYAEILTDFGATERIVFNKCTVIVGTGYHTTPGTGHIEKVRQDVKDISFGILKMEGGTEFYDPSIYNEIPDTILQALDAPDVAGHVEWIDPQALITERITYGRSLIRTSVKFIKDTGTSGQLKDSLGSAAIKVAIFLKEIELSTATNMSFSHKDLLLRLNDLDQKLQQLEEAFENCKKMAAEQNQQ